MTTLALYSLPDLTRKFDVRIPALAPEPEEHCLVCQSKFSRSARTSTPEPELNPTMAVLSPSRNLHVTELEETCEPIQIHPCGHYIGVECFKQLIHSGFGTHCLLCRRKIAVKSSTLNRALKFLGTLKWFKLQLDVCSEMLGNRVRSNPGRMHDEMTRLNDAFVSGTATIAQAFALWKLHMHGLLTAYSILGLLSTIAYFLPVLGCVHWK